MQSKFDTRYSSIHLNVMARGRRLDKRLATALGAKKRNFTSPLLFQADKREKEKEGFCW